MTFDKENELYEQAIDWVYQAGKLIRDRINDPLVVDIKSDPNDIVTSMDRDIEQFLAEKIKHYYPNHLILSEEGFGDHVTSEKGTIWIIDPIDGTINFYHQKRNFAISLGIFHNGVGEIGLIYDVMADTLYQAKRGQGALKNGKPLQSLTDDVKLEKAVMGFNHHWLRENRLVDERVMQSLVKTIRGTRSYGSAAIELAYVAEGALDGYLSMGLSPWDIAAGVVLIHEVGGKITDMTGADINILKRQSIVACHPKIHDTVIHEFLLKARK